MRWLRWSVLAAACLGAPCGAQGVAKPAVAAPPAVQVEDRNAPVEFQGLPGARAKTNEILARKEFRQVKPNTFWDNAFGKVISFVNNAFSRMAR